MSVRVYPALRGVCWVGRMPFTSQIDCRYSPVRGIPCRKLVLTVRLRQAVSRAALAGCPCRNGVSGI